MINAVTPNSHEEIIFAIEKTKGVEIKTIKTPEIKIERPANLVNENLERKVAEEVHVVKHEKEEEAPPVYKAEKSEEEYHHVQTAAKRLPQNRLAMEVKDDLYFIKIRTMGQNMRNLNPNRGILSWMEHNGGIVIKKPK
ncbi:MAG TPA: hypothetical protein VJI46_05150 [Candidatus Nanoarchaeia archaeon]|nr:hypothetical protein [Candidatus Nanoarchaeia archaeon]